MPQLFQTVFDLQSDRQAIIDRPYGMVEVIDGRLQAIHLRPWPKMISSTEVAWLGGFRHQRMRCNRCRLYYNQPVGHRNFLALKYVVSSLGTTLATIRVGMRVLDEIARLKGSDAIVCEASNRRITDRVMKYSGFESHLPGSRRKHYIRRFYGDYPEPWVGDAASVAAQR